MSVGANIRKRRQELRMSQQELADAMGYRTRSTIAKIESGENDVSQKKLQRFVVIFLVFRWMCGRIALEFSCIQEVVWVEI